MIDAILCDDRSPQVPTVAQFPTGPEIGVRPSRYGETGDLRGAMTLDYGYLLVAFGINLVAISVLTYGLYFRRHQRRDLTLGFVGVNIGLFAVSAFTTTTTISVGFGIGLFALLSVIRLRSSTASQEEIGYYFVALVIGIVNGLAVEGSWVAALVLDAMLLAVMFVADHPRLLRHAERQELRLSGTPPAGSP